MTENREQDKPRRRVIDRNHQKRSLWVWVVPLVVILAIIIFLPRLVEYLE